MPNLLKTWNRLTITMREIGKPKLKISRKKYFW